MVCPAKGQRATGLVNTYRALRQSLRQAAQEGTSQVLQEGDAVSLTSAIDHRVSVAKQDFLGLEVQGNGQGSIHSARIDNDPATPDTIAFSLHTEHGCGGAPGVLTIVTDQEIVFTERHQRGFLGWGPGRQVLDLHLDERCSSALRAAGHFFANATHEQGWLTLDAVTGEVLRSRCQHV